MTYGYLEKLSFRPKIILSKTVLSSGYRLDVHQFFRRLGSEGDLG